MNDGVVVVDGACTYYSCQSASSFGLICTIITSICTLFHVFFVGILGSSHSDKEVDTPAPEKQIPKVPAPERKRKRKADDTISLAKSGENSSGATPTSSSKSSKKINDYFASKAPSGSPIRNSSQGAKSPSPHQNIKSNVSKKQLLV